MGDAPMSLEGHFGELFTQWDHGQQPADAAEFTYFVLRWMDSACFSDRWGRFYTVENQTQMHDRGDKFHPLFLQTPNSAITSTCLQDLLNLWTEEYGMTTTLLDSPEIVICHVDRFDRLPDGSMHKLQFWLHADTQCTIPVMHSDGSQVLQNYVPVALLAHMGDHERGHFQAALRLTVGDGPAAFHTQHTLWAVTNDNVEPKIQPLPGLPAWLCKNITMIWLVRSDAVDIFRPLRDPGAGWLRLRELRKQVALNVAGQSVQPIADGGPQAQPLTPQHDSPDRANADLQASVEDFETSTDDTMASLVRLMSHSET
eukprot:s3600_g4.t1